MQEYQLSNRQARQLVLQWQGLWGSPRFAGPAGALAYIRQAGCIQYDPVDLCGKNPELVLFARVSSFRKSNLHGLLYKKKALVDHWDKNMTIFPVEDWPYLARSRARSRHWHEAYIQAGNAAAQVEEVRRILQSRPTTCSKDLGMNQKINWAWAPTAVGRAALEYLYFSGDAVIHHREGAVRHYAPATRHLPAILRTAPDPHADEAAYYAWHALRRIASVGLLANGPSDAFLGIPDFNAATRHAAFARLLQEDKLLCCRVAGIPKPLYAPLAARPLLHGLLGLPANTNNTAASAPPQPASSTRLALLPPLDNMLWDRKLIRALFGFDYKWEIYTPAQQRKYGPYTLPVLYGDRFAGRIQLQARREAGFLEVCRFWPEADFRPGKQFAARLQTALLRLARFNDCTALVPMPGCKCPGISSNF